MSKVVILGAYGMVGAAFKKENPDAIALDKHDCDITIPESISRMIEIYEPDIIINSAVIYNYDACKKNPELAYRPNSIGPLNLAIQCRDNDITLVQLSTVNVFKGDTSTPYTEDSIPNPMSIYGKSKYIAELYVGSICDKFYIIRMPTMFGHVENHKNIGFTEKMLIRMRDNKELRVADDKVESISHTRDIAKEVYRIIEDKLPYGIYHISNEGCMSYYEFIVEIVKQLGKSINVEGVSRKVFPDWETKPGYASLSSIKIKPLRNWKKALKDYLNEQNII